MKTSTGAVIHAVVLVLASGAWAQEDLETYWVSGVGDDANPCDRTAPCLTLAGALAVAPSGTTIKVLDPVDLGQVTINKSITIDARTMLGGISPTTSGVVIDAQPTDVVVLRGLSLAANQSGTQGIRFIAGKALHVQHCTLVGFTDTGIDFQPAAGGSLYVQNSSIRGGGSAAIVVASSNASAIAVISETSMNHNAIGVVAGANGRVTGAAIVAEGNTEACLLARPDGGVSEINVEGGQLTGSVACVKIDAPTGNAVVRLSNAMVIGNGITTEVFGNGLVHSFGNNRILGGSSVACPAGSTTLGPSSFPAGIAGLPYQATALISRGIIGAPVFSAAPPLPPGLVLDNGFLHGTPTRAGTTTHVLTQTDGNACSSSTSATLAIVCPATSLAPSTVLSGITGAPLPATTFVMSGTTSTAFTWQSVGTLPIGVTFNAGVLSGTPTEAGSYPLTVTATDSYMCSATIGVVLSVVLDPSYQPTTTVLASSENPTAVGRTIELLATISAAGPGATGKVTFWEGITLVGTEPLVGNKANLSTSKLSAGSHGIVAIYTGDQTFGGSVSPEIVQVVASVSIDAGIDLDDAGFSLPDAGGGEPDLGVEPIDPFEPAPPARKPLPEPTRGCGCGATEGSMVFAALALLGLRRRRR